LEPEIWKIKTEEMTVKRVFCVGVTLLFIVSAIIAQKDAHPWTEWSQKDVQKMLSDSPWTQTQLETEAASGSTGAVTSNNVGTLSRDASKPTPGAVTSYIKYFVRFLSARPIRQAVARQRMLAQPSMEPQMLEQLKAFAEATSGDYIVIAVAAEASDQKMGGAAIRALDSATVDTLKDVTFLERADGQKVQLLDYRAPVNDGLGAKFVFPRQLNNQPFMAGDSVRFTCQLSKTIKLLVRYRVADMSYNGQLEY